MYVCMYLEREKERNPDKQPIANDPTHINLNCRKPRSCSVSDQATYFESIHLPISLETDTWTPKKTTLFPELRMWRKMNNNLNLSCLRVWRSEIRSSTHMPEFGVRLERDWILFVMVTFRLNIVARLSCCVGGFVEAGMRS